jgi:putative tryptophan/tyrosine transport system substrate-binding protein
VPVVGYLSTFPENGRSFGSAIFRKALSDAGYVDGQNVAIEFRSSDGQTSRLQSAADKLVAERVAVIVASQFVAGFAAKNATATIPIIFTVGSSPAALEQVRSMIRPDGNVTAVSQVLPPIAPKRLEIIRELMPDAKTVAFLDNPVGQAYPAESQSIALSEAAEALGIRIEVLQARNNDEMEKLFGAWTGQQCNALIVTPHPFYISVRPRLIELANSHAIPTIYPFYEDAVAGGLMLKHPLISGEGFVEQLAFVWDFFVRSVSGSNSILILALTRILREISCVQRRVPILRFGGLTWISPTYQSTKREYEVRGLPPRDAKPQGYRG